jgi:hypothetical protein
MRLLAEMDVVPCSTLGAQTGAAPLTTPASAAPASATNAQLQFVASWKSTIAPKLHQLLSLLQSKEVATVRAPAGACEARATPQFWQSLCFAPWFADQPAIAPSMLRCPQSLAIAQVRCVDAWRVQG